MEDRDRRSERRVSNQYVVGLPHGALGAGRPDDAVRIMRRIPQADPLTPAFAVWEADFLDHSGQLDAAAALYEQTIHDEPSAHAFFGLAESDARRAGLTKPSRPGDVAMRPPTMTPWCRPRNSKGRRRISKIERMAARQELEALRGRAASGTRCPWTLPAPMRSWVRWSRHSAIPGSLCDCAPGLVFLKADRSWDAIRGDPPFLAAVRRVNLP